MRLAPRLLAPLLVLVVLAPAGTAAASAEDDARRTLERAEALLGGATTAAADGDGREATVLLRDLALLLPRLEGSERERAERLLGRPTNDNDVDSFGNEDPASPICDPNFCIHWGDDPAHRPPAADSQPDGIPDYIEEVLAAAQRSFAIENVQLGWREARGDGVRGAANGRGGGGRLDIYVVGLPRGLFGYTATDPGETGAVRAGYLVIDNDYAGFGGRPLELMRVTIAHEYNHALQFAYDVFQDAWMFESTATWIEEHVYPEVDDYFNFLPAFLRNPHKPLAELDRRAIKLYGSALWNHWLANRYGAGVVRRAWEVSRKVRPKDFAVAAYERAIVAAGGPSFAEEFGRFAAGTAELNAVGAFPDAGSYSDVTRSGRLGSARQRLRLDHTGYRLFRVRGRSAVRLIARVQRRTRAALALVGRIGPRTKGTVETAFDYLPRGGRAAVRLRRPGGYRRITAVLINADGRVRGGSRNYIRDDRRFKARVRR